MLSPAAWLAGLEAQLSRQQAAIQLPEEYYAGQHRLSFQTRQFRESFGAMFKALAINWCKLPVDAAVNQLEIWGFRFGDDTKANTDAWDIFQANDLDQGSLMAHTEAGKDGAVALLVAPPAAGSKWPQITVEHASQMAVAVDTANRRNRLAALKKWRGEDGYDYATLYLPGRIMKFRSQGKRSDTGAGGRVNWQLRPGDEGGRNGFGVVSAIPMLNKPTLLGGGQSDLADAIGIQDAINKLIADMLVASEFVAYPQRVMMGVEVPTDEDGNPDTAAQLKASVSRFWALEDPNAKIGEFSAADLGNYVNTIRSLVEDYAAITGTPPYYISGQVVNISGDAMLIARDALDTRVERKHIDFSGAWEEALRLSFKALDKNDLAQDFNAETIWKPARKVPESQMWDAATKMRTVGIPLEVIWERAGFTPKQIAHMKSLTGLPDTPPPGATTADVPPVLSTPAQPPSTTT